MATISHLIARDGAGDLGAILIDDVEQHYVVSRWSDRQTITCKRLVTALAFIEGLDTVERDDDGGE